MNFSKAVTSVVVSLSFFSLACGLVEIGSYDCEVYCDPDWQGEWVCWQYCEGEWDFPSSFSTFVYHLDSAQVRTDTAGSNVLIDSLGGSGSLVARNEANQIVESDGFAWSRVGTKIKFQNPNAISQFLDDAADEDAVNVKVTFNDIEITPVQGMNVFKSTLKYDGESIISDQDSFYCQEPGQTTGYYCGGN